MNDRMLAICLGGALLLLAALLALDHRPARAHAARQQPVAEVGAAEPAADRITLSAPQARQVQVVTVARHAFVPHRDAIGTIDFDQDRSVAASSQFPGRVRQILVKAGDDVRRDQPLFSLDSPDLLNAESVLISSAAALRLSNAALERQRRMVDVQAAAQKDLEQAIAEQQTAEGNHRAARHAVQLFGKSDADIERIVEQRAPDGELMVRSPIAGRVIARNLAPGQLLQPGATPAPLVITDLSLMWLLANLREADIPLLHVHAPVEMSVLAYPDRVFRGEVSFLGESIDPNTHRLPARSEIHDPGHLLRPQMLASYRIQVGAPQPSPAIPQNAVVREGDGTLSAFLTQDGRVFQRRDIRIGMIEHDQVQVLEGLRIGERVAADGALFLAAALALRGR